MIGKKRQTLLLALLDEMVSAGSWAGETHIQKSVYFLQHALNVPLEFEFILYKHGPYSFDLHDQLEQMLGDLILQSFAQYPYGPSLRAGPSAAALRDHFPRTYAEYSDQVRFVAKEISAHDVLWLERAATALFVTEEYGGSREERAKTISDLKPHVSRDAALASLEEVDDLLKRGNPLSAE